MPLAGSEPCAQALYARAPASNSASSTDWFSRRLVDRTPLGDDTPPQPGLPVPTFLGPHLELGKVRTYSNLKMT